MVMDKESYEIWKDGTDEEKFADVADKFKRGYLYFEALVFSCMHCSLRLRLRFEQGGNSNVEEIWIGEISEYQGKPFWYFPTYQIKGFYESWILEDVKQFLLNRVGSEMLPSDKKELEAINEEGVMKRISLMVAHAYKFSGEAIKKRYPKEEEEEDE